MGKKWCAATTVPNSMPDGENFQTAWIVDFFTAVPVYTVEAVQAFTADTLFA